MRSSLLLAAATLLLPTAAAAQSMNAEVFHKRATALAKKGPMALFSRSEIKALMKEGQAAGQRSREIRLATLKAGGKPRSCPPEGKQSIGTEEFMRRLSAIPQAERAKIDMTEAMIRISAQKFPCKA
jgi:hypothetical protein